jgi:hypothetical protein
MNRKYSIFDILALHEQFRISMTAFLLPFPIFSSMSQSLNLTSQDFPSSQYLKTQE